jgi:hypothetical protein
MHSRTTITSKSDYFKKSREAIAKAAEDAREIGIKSGTGIVVVKSGRVTRLTPDELSKYGMKSVRVRLKSAS